MFDLKNKVIVITGATGVLASSLALSLAKNNARLVLLGRNQKLLDELTKKTNQYTVVENYTADVLKKSDLEKVCKKVVKSFDRIDVLVNAVGGNLPGAVIPDSKSIFDFFENDFDEVVDLNLKGTIMPSVVFGKVMAKQASGSIINYSSMTVDRVITRVVGYSAAKAAMENFTRWMAVEMALKFGDGIRVNAIAPGFFIGKQNPMLPMWRVFFKPARAVRSSNPGSRHDGCDLETGTSTGTLHFREKTGSAYHSSTRVRCTIARP